MQEKYEKKKKKKKIKNIIIGVILTVVLLLVGGMILSYQAAKSMGIGSAPVADYEMRIEIWDTVAGNNSGSKLEDMNINYKKQNTLFATIRFADAIVNSDYSDVEEAVDTFTYLYEIKGGYEKETYEDEPYLIPYLVEDSDAAVIVIPGGGFGYKSMDGGNSEGKDIAETLNKNGINAFVLHYRTNPYEYPIPYLDVQRAIRYLRYHAEEYNLDKDKISLIGFSAGGNMIGTFINVIQGNDFFPEDYVKDEIDAIDDFVNSGAMIYPAMSFRYNVPMLFCLFDDELVRDETSRNELLELTDLYRHFTSEDVKQFIAYGTKDGMVGMDETLNYIDYAKRREADVTVVEAKGQDHGVRQEYYMNDYLNWLTQTFKNNNNGE